MSKKSQGVWKIVHIVAGNTTVETLHDNHLVTVVHYNSVNIREQNEKKNLPLHLSSRKHSKYGGFRGFPLCQMGA